MIKNKFWQTAQKCSEIVKTWPEWKREIKITSETCNTGNFIKKIPNKDRHKH